jgi:hypothetical protein
VSDVFNSWFVTQILEKKKINLVSGRKIGTKLTNDKPLGLEELFASDNENLPNAGYGILIPHEEVLIRKNYQWFARMSEKEILDSDMVISNYLSQALS